MRVVEAAARGALTRAEMVRYAQGAMSTANMMLESTPEETTEPMRLLGFGLAMLQGVRNHDGVEWTPKAVRS